MYRGKSILAIIPARGGSKGIPRKNIKNLAGKPMIAWSIEAAKKSKYVDRIIVSTEDEEIKNISIQYGAEIPFLRPMELAQDNTSSSDTILHTIKKMIIDENSQCDFILLLQPTSPLRTEYNIDESIEMLINNLDNFNSLISVTELEHPVYWNRTVDRSNKLKEYIRYDKSTSYRRQDFDKMYRLNGAIYIIDTDIFITYKKFETDQTMAYIMDRKSSLDVDDLEDFELAGYYLHKRDLKLINTENGNL